MRRLYTPPSRGPKSTELFCVALRELRVLSVTVGKLLPFNNMGVFGSCLDRPKSAEITLSQPEPKEPEERYKAIEELPPDAKLHPELEKVYNECKEGRSHAVKSIRLLWRDLSGDYVAYLNFLLTKCTEIEDLVLKSNDLGAHGLVRLGPGLKNLRKLKKLSISQNKLTDEGLHTLGVLLEGHRELLELTLDNNQIADILPLLSLMQKLPKLKVVWLQSNRITNSDLFLSYKGSCTDLNLSGNPVDEGLAVRLREVFPQLIV
mmetsp:Transcript_34225/g.59889  ORF Transcript_34225/g.59889 Transcript_34225/m.59889 type:complete len:262 (-) Transcript_34225:2957-3742(-)